MLREIAGNFHRLLPRAAGAGARAPQNRAWYRRPQEALPESRAADGDPDPAVAASLDELATIPVLNAENETLQMFELNQSSRAAVEKAKRQAEGRKERERAAPKWLRYTKPTWSITRLSMLRDPPELGDKPQLHPGSGPSNRGRVTVACYLIGREIEEGGRAVEACCDIWNTNK